MSWSVDLKLKLGRFTLEVDLSLDEGPITIIGPNGSGKSTLLRAIAGAYALEFAKIEVAGRSLVHTEQGIELPPEERRIGYVPQGFGLFPHLSVLDNIAFAAPTSLSTSERRERARAQLQEMDASALEHRLPATLSGGERQRIALARALFSDPDILLLDEPLAALDAGARRRVRAQLVEQIRPDRPAILVTHDVRDARALGAPIYALEAGRVVQQGRVEELSSAPKTDFIAEFFSPA